MTTPAAKLYLSSGGHMANRRSDKWMLLGGVAAGSAALYFLDPKRGSERRETFAKKARHIAAGVAGGAAKSTRDSLHHLAGMARQAYRSLGREWPEDRVLVERIRSRMGRIVLHPHRIHVASDDGVVTLWGSASEYEGRTLVHVVQAIAGVKEVMNHLEIHENSEPTMPEPNAYKQARRETLLGWSPSKRLLAGMAGTAAAIYGWKRKDSLGVCVSLLGAGLAAASTMERNVHSVLSFSEDSPGFELEKTIRINAPVSDIFDFWANPENYPKVFSHISSIERLGENLYRWTVIGPAGIPVHWEGTITRSVPNTIVEWKSLPGSTVGNFGFIRVDTNYDASTRVLVRMFYRPPAGILGRFFAQLLGTDPKKVLDQDLKRLKLLFETNEEFITQLREGGERTDLLKTATT
jgi:uncharacterized membrane protein/osmotically-inducible protein OsmY